MTLSGKRLCVGSIGRLVLGATTLVFLAASVAAARPSVTAAGSTAGDSTTFTVSHTPSGVDPLLTVCVAMGVPSGATVTGVTFIDHCVNNRTPRRFVLWGRHATGGDGGGVGAAAAARGATA